MRVNVFISAQEVVIVNACDVADLVADCVDEQILEIVKVDSQPVHVYYGQEHWEVIVSHVQLERRPK